MLEHVSLNISSSFYQASKPYLKYLRLFYVQIYALHKMFCWSHMARAQNLIERNNVSQTYFIE